MEQIDELLQHLQKRFGTRVHLDVSSMPACTIEVASHLKLMDCRKCLKTANEVRDELINMGGQVTNTYARETDRYIVYITPVLVLSRIISTITSFIDKKQEDKKEEKKDDEEQKKDVEESHKNEDEDAGTQTDDGNQQRIQKDKKQQA